MRALLTGGSGFVGRHLAALLRDRGFETIAAGRAGSRDCDVALDFHDARALRAAVRDVAPGAVFHLAAQASVPGSIRDPLKTYEINMMGTARLFEALRGLEPMPRVLFVSSADVYGIQDAAAYPLRETALPRINNPYAASKIAGEAIALAAFRTCGVPAIVTRAFNHIGPGQSDAFAVASFASQLAAIEAGGPPLMRVGNLSAQRDFLDVRDVVRAYVAIFERGRPGEIYNVCSGTPIAMQEILRRLITIARVPVEVREDPERMRPSDIPVSYGDPSKLKAETAWERTISLDATLRDVVADARERIAVAP